MREAYLDRSQTITKVAIVVSGVLFLYAMVLTRLARDWWFDENYSHGLLVPFVIVVIVWLEWDRLKAAVTTPWGATGASTITIALVLLTAGMLGAELFTQRISLVLMAGGIVIYLFGGSVLKLLAVPFALLILAIPIPQILFNRIAFPLQIWASQMAVWGIRLFEVPTVRKGNVIDILPRGSTQPISLEVVEACSGIRSLMTLLTLALILAYFTRHNDGGRFGNFSRPDLIRAGILMVLAVPIAVITNAARVTATAYMTYTSGKQATSATVHDASGWIVYVVALGMLIGVNLLLKRVLRASDEITFAERTSMLQHIGWKTVAPLAVAMVLGGIAINWYAGRAEIPVERQALEAVPTSLGNWRQKGSSIRFSERTESVLGASDYTMREYVAPDGRMANIYVGYYASQRTGATYHSPQNCLPGAGWIMSDPQQVEITTKTGKTFTANLYNLENGIYRQVMIYWYQGRGRTEASEYRDKLNVVWDSVVRRRTDGAIVRVMTDAGGEPDSAITAATELAIELEHTLLPFIPE